jgi:hypothetical protein
MLAAWADALTGTSSTRTSRATLGRRPTRLDAFDDWRDAEKAYGHEAAKMRRPVVDRRRATPASNVASAGGHARGVGHTQAARRRRQRGQGNILRDLP